MKWRLRLLPSYAHYLGPLLTIPLGFGWLTVKPSRWTLFSERSGFRPSVQIGPIRISFVRPRKFPA
jgi:hypothetical protein